jgi:hypothetical protein
MHANHKPIKDDPMTPSSLAPAVPLISVLVECGGRTYRVIDSLRSLVGGESDRTVSERKIGRKVLDVAKMLEAK